MQELITKSARRISNLFLPVATVSVFLLAFLWIEHIGRCDELAQQCNNNSECISLTRNAESEKAIADIHAQHDDSQRGHYGKAAKLYYSAYKIDANPEFLFRACALVGLANSGTNDCGSKRCYLKLLSSHSDASVVQNYKDTIDLSLASCTRQEAAQNVPLVDWSKSLKPGFSGPIYIQKAEKSLQELSSEHEAQLERSFPHHYRTELAGKILIGMGVSGLVLGEAYVMMQMHDCILFCPLSTELRIESRNNLLKTSGFVAIGAGALSISGLVTSLIPRFSKKFGSQRIRKLPVYDYAGNASNSE